MPNVGRTSHDKTPYSKVNQRLERQLRQEIKLYINHQLIPSLRFPKTTRHLAFVQDNYSKLILPYTKASYRLGAFYVSRIFNHEVANSVGDDSRVTQLHKDFYFNFTRKINALINMERTENRKSFQIIAAEKERIAGELSSEIAWTSYNQGVKCKGIEMTVQGVPRRGLVSMKREIRSPDLKTVTTQKIFVDRVQTKGETREQIAGRERTHALDTAEEAKISFVFITQHDERVCEECRSMEFQSWAAADPDIPNIPDDTHENCRCILMVAESTESDEKTEMLRRAIIADTVFTSASIKEFIALAAGGESLEELIEHARAHLKEKKKKKKKKKT